MCRKIEGACVCVGGGAPEKERNQCAPRPRVKVASIKQALIVALNLITFLLSTPLLRLSATCEPFFDFPHLYDLLDNQFHFALEGLFQLAAQGGTQ